MARRDLVAALDVGTTKVLALVAQVHRRGQMEVIGVGSSPSRGLRKGVVVDIDSTVRAIQEAVRKAQRMSGFPLQSVYLGVAGGHIQSQNNRAVVAVTGRDREITAEDVERVLEAARVISIPPDREIVHVLPRQYIVDGYDGIHDPIGMTGSRLEVEAHIVTGVSATLQNLYRSVDRAGLEVEEVVFAPLAAGEAVLVEDEKELGVALADIGGGTTDIAVFSNGSLFQSAVLPLGGEYITTDVAIGLRTSLAQAEVVKIDYGYATPHLAPEGKVFPVPGVGGQGIHQVPAKTLAEIIEARLGEILAGIRSVLKESGLIQALPGGLVLTGGVAATRGIADLAAQELGVPVRVGTPANLGGLQDMTAAPAFATGVGLLAHALNRSHPRVRDRGAPSRGGFTERVRDWFRDWL